MTTPPDRLADTLRAALDEEGGEDDDALVARAVARAMTRIADEASEPAPVARISERARAASGRRWLRVAIPLAAAFAASIAMAAVMLANRAPTPAAPAPAAAPSPTPASPTAKAATAGTPAPDTTPTMSVEDLPSAKLAPAVMKPATVAPSEAAPSAAELFRTANTERRAGDVAKAIELYRTLQKEHPGSPESQASHVSLGRLLLDRQNDAAGALPQFDAYLKSGASDGTLAEEARIGRALALQRLGRSDDERRAWQELLDRHPQSLYAPRARERLGALGGPGRP